MVSRDDKRATNLWFPKEKQGCSLRLYSFTTNDLAEITE